MTTQDTPSFDDLETVNTSDESDDYDTDWLDLEPGESVVGEIRAIKPNCGQYGTTVIELARGLCDIVAMWSNGQIDSAVAVGVACRRKTGARRARPSFLSSPFLA